MIDFLKENYALVIGAVIVVVAVVRVVLTLMKANRIDKEGIETDAVVTRVVEDFDPDNAVTSYSTYVEYRDENGELRESYMALTMDAEHEVGDKLRIKYVPGVRDLVRAVDK